MGIQKMPVDSSATLVMRHATSQSARRCRSVVKVEMTAPVPCRDPADRHHMRRGTAVNAGRIRINAL